MRATSRQVVRVASQHSWQGGGRTFQQQAAAAAAAAAHPHAPIHMSSRDRDSESALAQQRRRLAEPRVTLAMVPEHARWIHMTARQDSAIVAAGIGLAATAYGAQYVSAHTRLVSCLAVAPDDGARLCCNHRI